MDLMHRHRLAIHNPTVAWWAIGCAAGGVAFTIWAVIYGGPYYGLGSASALVDLAVGIVIMALAIIVLAGIAVAVLSVLGRAVSRLGSLLHRFAMGGNHPSCVKEDLQQEFQRTHDAKKCTTCGGTYYARKVDQI